MHCMRWLSDSPWSRTIRRLFFGISPGGMGVLLYASEYQGHVEGLVLAAPFPGTQGSIAEIAIAGGFAPRAVTPDLEEGMLIGRAVARSASRLARIHLGYGRAERLGQRHRMLAGSLPVDHAEMQMADATDTLGSTFGTACPKPPFFEIFCVGDV